MPRPERYSAEEARRIIMTMPDGPDSDDPDFSGGEGDLHEEIVTESSSSDSDDSESDDKENDPPAPGPGIGLASGRGRGCSRTMRDRRRGLLRGKTVQGRSMVQNSDQRWGGLDKQKVVDYPSFSGRHGPSEPLGIDSEHVDFWKQLFPDDYALFWL